LKRIQQSKFPGQTCDLLALGSIGFDLDEDIVVTSISDYTQDLTSFKQHLQANTKCLIVAVEYDNSDALKRVDELTEEKPNSLVVGFGSVALVDYVKERWTPVVYVQRVETDFRQVVN
jgi:hypothetical protein